MKVLYLFTVPQKNLIVSPEVPAPYYFVTEKEIKIKMNWQRERHGQAQLKQRERNTSMSIWFQATGQLERPIPEP